MDLSVINKSWKASLGHYDREYAERAVALWRDPRIAGRYYVLSGSRSRAHQAVLYASFLAGVGNPANRPGTSNHEWSDTRGATAMDVHPIAGKGGSFAELHKVAAEYGFYFPFANRAKSPEDWHMELRPGRGPLPVVSKPTKKEDDRYVSDSAFTVTYPTGGKVRLTESGALLGFGVAVYASMHSIKDEGKRNFIKHGPGALTAVDPNDPKKGVIIWDAVGGEYHMTADGVADLKRRGLYREK